MRYHSRTVETAYSHFSTHMIDLRKLSHGKQFERLCADLLDCEGFRVEEEAIVDTSGIDIIATCEYRAHASSLKPVRLRWLVQCKHFAKSAQNLHRDDVVKILVNYLAVRRTHDALLVMVSSDYSEPAMRAVQEAVRDKRDVEIEIWNGRRIVALLEKHPHLVNRYGLRDHPSNVGSWWPCRLVNAKNRSVLIVSDQSCLAHDLCAYLSMAGAHVVFLPV
jgi:hypothetical protein